MIQALMYFALGLLCAGGLVLVLTPAIWRRAQRLTRARVESAVPLSLAEIQAEKDQLRAEFAMAGRRLEMTAERLKAENLDYTVEINRKREEIARLVATHAGASKTIAELETRVSGLAETLAATETRLAATVAELAERDRTLAERVADLGASQANAARLEELSDEQKLELVARNTEIANLSDRIAAAALAERNLETERDGLLAALAAERTTLAAERVRAEQIEADRVRLESERDRLLVELEQRGNELKAVEPAMAAAEARANAFLSEIGGLRVEIGGLKAEAEKQRDGMKALEDRLATRAGEIVERDRRVAALETDLLAAGGRHSALLQDMDGLRAEIERQRAETEAVREKLTGRAVEIEKRDNWVKALEADVAGERSRTAELLSEIERLKAERDAGVGQGEALKADLASRSAELEKVWGEVTLIEGKNAATEERLAAAVADAARARTELAARDAHAAEIEKRLSEAMSEILALEMKADKAATFAETLAPAASARGLDLGERLAVLQREYATLRSENDELRRLSGGEWDTVRAENALLRERLAALASDIVGMAERGNGPRDAGQAARAGSTVVPLAAAPSGDAPAETSDRLPTLQQASRH